MKTIEPKSTQYAKRLVDKGVPRYAKRLVDKGVPRCAHCCKLLATSIVDKAIGPQPVMVALEADLAAFVSEVKTHMANLKDLGYTTVPYLGLRSSMDLEDMITHFWKACPCCQPQTAVSIATKAFLLYLATQQKG